jgi:hypothetical protein
MRSILAGYLRDGSRDGSQVRQIMAAAEAGLAGREHCLPSERVFQVTERSRLPAYDSEFVALGSRRWNRWCPKASVQDVPP